MSDVVSPLLQWLNANPELAGLTTFFISAAESVAIIGTIVPGSVTMTAIGALAGAGVIPLYETILWAMLGAIVGDGISYWLGYYFKNRIRNIWPFRGNPQILAKGEEFVHKYGIMSVFIGRFVGPVRALVPLVAGMLGMQPMRFTIANVASAIGWAPAYMLPGILLGAASLELPPDIAVHVILVLFLMFMFTLLCVWVLYKLLQLIHNQIDQFLSWIWQSLKKSRYFHIATIALKHHDPRKHYGQLILAFYLLVTCALLLSLIVYVKHVGPGAIFVNDALFHMARGLRSDSADKVMLAITLLGQKQVIVPVAIVLVGWLFYVKRARTACHLLAVVVLTGVSIYLLKHAVHVLRPWGLVNNADTYSMPSGHTAMATSIYIGIAFFIANSYNSVWRRRFIYLLPVLLVIAISISRIYLGAHWFTDIVAAWLLSIAVLLLVIISYRRDKEAALNTGKITLICVITLALTSGIYFITHYHSTSESYLEAEWPSVNISAHDWWQKNNLIPAMRVSLFGFPSHPINVEWAGELNEIKEVLLKQGWEEPPDRDWVSILHRISDIKSNEFLPLISPQYLDKRPVLTLTRTAKELRRVVVIQLWRSNRFMQHTNTPLWVGTVKIIPRSFSWLFRKQNQDFTISANAVFAKTSQQKQWESKLILVKPTKNGKPLKSQTILLIRKK